jgi:hypothetical protein
MWNERISSIKVSSGLDIYIIIIIIIIIIIVIEKLTVGCGHRYIPGLASHLA